MQIVIEIPDFLYQIIQDCKVIEGADEGTVENVLVKAVENGVVLPKGHGDLKDADKLTESVLCKTFGLRSIDIENASTIIEADKESEEV